MDPLINEADLIKKGKEMIEDGLGATFVLKWVKDRVEDQEAVSRIVSSIHTYNTPKPKSKDELLRNRNIRKAKFLYQDYKESIRGIQKLGMIVFLLGMVYLVSVFLGGDSLRQCILAIALGTGIFLSTKLYDLENKRLLLTLLGVYITVPLFSWIIFGLPDRLLPTFPELVGGRFGVILSIANNMTPYLFFIIQFLMAYVLIKALHYEKEVSQLSNDLKSKVKVKNR